jgi:hypothetical protein
VRRGLGSGFQHQRSRICGFHLKSYGVQRPHFSAERLFEAKHVSEIAELLERSLLPCLRAPGARDMLIRAVLQRLGRRLEQGDRPVKGLAVELGVGERTLRRYCAEMSFGIPQWDVRD